MTTVTSHRTATPPEKWGKDHWSTLAYVAHWCAEYGAKGFEAASDRHRRQMRVDSAIHPLHAHAPAIIDDMEYPTRLAGGEKLNGHDDWSCVDDIEAAGFIEIKGTGVYPVLFMTTRGLEVASLLRNFKTRGGNYGEFCLATAENGDQE